MQQHTLQNTKREQHTKPEQTTIHKHQTFFLRQGGNKTKQTHKHGNITKSTQAEHNRNVHTENTKHIITQRDHNKQAQQQQHNAFISAISIIIATSGNNHKARKNA